MITRSVLGAVAGVALGAIQPVQAATPQWMLGAGLHYSDNIGKTATNEQKEWTRVLLGGLTYREDTKKLQANIKGYLEYLNYQRKTYPNETRGTLNAKVLLHQIPDRLVWDVEDYYSQAPQNVFAANTPANRQNANIFLLGPEVKFTPWNAGEGAVGVRYTDIYFESTPADNRRWSAYARVGQDLSRTTRVSGQIRSEWTDFRNQTLNPNFRRYDGWVSLEANAQGFSGETPPAPEAIGAGLDIGGTRFTRDRGTDKSGYLLRAHLETGPGGVWRVSLRGRSELTDTGSDLLAMATRPPSATLARTFSLLDLQVSGEIYRERAARLEVVRSGEVNTFSVSGDWRKENYVDATQRDRTVKGGGAAFARQINPTTVGTVFGARSRQELVNTGENIDDWLAGVRIARQLNVNWWLNFEAMHEKRDSSVARNSYTENRGYLVLSYGQNIVTGY